MSEHRELATELMIDADNLFPQVGGRVVSANEILAAGGGREDAAVFATSVYQRLRVGAQQSGWNLVIGRSSKGDVRLENRLVRGNGRIWVQRLTAVRGARP